MSQRSDYRIRFVDRHQAVYEAVDSDRSPLGPQEVSGKTVVSLISAGTELAEYSKHEGFPKSTGYAAIFRIEDVGSEVRNLRIGDLAYCMGPHQSFQRTTQNKALRLPDGLPPEHAVFSRMMSVSMTTLTTTKARPPQRVLITGLGLVGHLAAQIFASAGYKVVACDPISWRRDLIQQMGIQQVYNTPPLEVPELVGNIALVVDCSGHEQAVIDGCRIVSKLGEVVTIGAPWVQRTDRSAHELLHLIFHNYIHLRSGWEWELPLHSDQGTQNSIYGNLEGALQWLAEGRIRVEGLYEKRAAGDASIIYQDLLQQKSSKLGTILDWSR